MVALPEKIWPRIFFGSHLRALIPVINVFYGEPGFTHAALGGVSKPSSILDFMLLVMLLRFFRVILGPREIQIIYIYIFQDRPFLETVVLSVPPPLAKPSLPLAEIG